MVKVYANPELLPMFNLWLEQTGSEALSNQSPLTYGDAQYYLFIRALDEGSNWSNYDMWSVLDEYYGDNPDYNWWKNGRKPHMTIAGLETSFGRRENLEEKLAEIIKSDRGWDEPLFDVEVVEPFENMLEWIQATPERRLDYEERIKATPDTLRKNGEMVFSLYMTGNYVTLLSLGDSEVGEAWLNSIYFTLRPGKAWPKPIPRNRTINHPGGIL